MKFKNKLTAISTLIIFQTAGFANASEMNIEPVTTADEIEIFDPNPEPEPVNTVDKIKTSKERIEERRRLAEERKAERQKLEDDRKAADNNINDKNDIPDEVQIAENPVPTDTDKTVETPTVITQNAVNYSSFNDIIQAVHFIPLYIPQKSGYTITSMSTIDKRIAEIRYSRRWDSTVELCVRTYRRAPGEKLKDISGVNGVKWRINVVDGTTIYIAKLAENKHVAAWAVGNYTFSAYVENMSFAGFHSVIADELIDLSTHYYL